MDIALKNGPSGDAAHDLNGNGDGAKICYVLIDYENVQPKDLALLQKGSFKVKVFLGPLQKNVPIAVAQALQPLGGKCEYCVVEKGGKDAVDFFIAYELGVLTH